MYSNNSSSWNKNQIILQISEHIIYHRSLFSWKVVEDLPYLNCNVENLN